MAGAQLSLGEGRSVYADRLEFDTSISAVEVSERVAAGDGAMDRIANHNRVIATVQDRR